MLRKELKVVNLVSLKQKEYKVGKYKTALVPSVSYAVEQRKGNSSGTDAEIGLCLFKPDNRSYYQFWGVHGAPSNLAQAMRGLRLLGQCPVIQEDTLCACYYAAGRHLDDTTEHYLDSLKQTGFTDVEEARLNVLAEKIDEDVFINNVLEPLAQQGTKFNIKEIIDEVKTGNLSMKSADALAPFI